MPSDDDELPDFTDPHPETMMLCVGPANRWPVSGWRRATRADVVAATGENTAALAARLASLDSRIERLRVLVPAAESGTPGAYHEFWAAVNAIIDVP